MVGSLDHQKQIDVLVNTSLVMQAVLAEQSHRQVPDDSLYLLGLLRQVKAVHDHSHHIVYLSHLEVEAIQKL